MSYNNCNQSYGSKSYGYSSGYSHPYVHHQNAHAYNHGYPSYHPALSYPGYGYSAPRYCGPSYASQSYGVPNVFSIIKTSPLTTDDNVCALNSYDTLTLESGTSDHLTITGDKTNKKVTFALKQVALNVAGDATAAGLLLAPVARRTSGTVTLNGTTAVATAANVVATPTAASGAIASRILLTDNTTGTAPTSAATLTITKAAGQFTIVSDQADDKRVFDYLVLN